MKKNNYKKQSYTNSREACFDILFKVFKDKENLIYIENSILNRVIKKDRGLVKNIVYTVFRKNGFLNFLIDNLCDFEPDIKTEIILKIGMIQIIYLDVPNYAAINETVNVADKMHQKSKSFVNAVLNRCVKEHENMLENLNDEYNIPKHFKESWKKFYGEEKYQDIISNLDFGGYIDFNIIDKTQIKNFEKFNHVVLPTGGVRVYDKIDVDEINDFENGKFWVQDYAAQIPIYCLGDIKGKTVVDMCSAPGGKTLQLASLGANVISVEKSGKRIKRLYENIERMNMQKNVKVIRDDCMSFVYRDKADIVVVDAPCSASGTIRKNPDICFSSTKNLAARLQKVQYKILENAMRSLKKGGTILFITCSLEPEEGEYHIDNLPSGLKLMPFRRSNLKGMERILSGKGTIRTYPGLYKDIGSMDGFFCAQFVLEE